MVPGKVIKACAKALHDQSVEHMATGCTITRAELDLIRNGRPTNACGGRSNTIGITQTQQNVQFHNFLIERSSILGC